MEHEGDNYTNNDRGFCYNDKTIIKGTGGREGRGTSGDHQNYKII